MAQRFRRITWPVAAASAVLLALTGCTSPTPQEVSDTTSQTSPTADSPSASPSPTSDVPTVYVGFEPTAQVVESIKNSLYPLGGMEAMIEGEYISPSTKYSIPNTLIQAALPVGLALSCKDSDVMSNIGLGTTEFTKTLKCEDNDISFSVSDIGKFDKKSFAKPDGGTMTPLEALENSCILPGTKGSENTRATSKSLGEIFNESTKISFKVASLKCEYKDDDGNDRISFMFSSYSDNLQGTTSGLYMGIYDTPSEIFSDHEVNAMWAGATAGTTTPLFLGVKYAMDAGAIPQASGSSAKPEEKQTAKTIDAQLVELASLAASSAEIAASKIDDLGCENPGDAWSAECLALIEAMPTEMDKAAAGITGFYEQVGTPETTSLDEAAKSARNAASYSYGISQKAVEAGCLSQNTPQREIPRAKDGGLVPCYMFFTTSYWHQYAENMSVIANS